MRGTDDVTPETEERVEVSVFPANCEWDESKLLSRVVEREMPFSVLLLTGCTILVAVYWDGALS